MSKSSSDLGVRRSCRYFYQPTRKYQHSLFAKKTLLTDLSFLALSIWEKLFINSDVIITYFVPFGSTLHISGSHVFACCCLAQSWLCFGFLTILIYLPGSPQSRSEFSFDVNLVLFWYFEAKTFKLDHNKGFVFNVMLLGASVYLGH